MNNAGLKQLKKQVNTIDQYLDLLSNTKKHLERLNRYDDGMDINVCVDHQDVCLPASYIKQGLKSHFNTVLSRLATLDYDCEQVKYPCDPCDGMLEFDVPTKFKLEFGRTYYGVVIDSENERVDCPLCVTKKKIEIGCKKYECPECRGHGRVVKRNEAVPAVFEFTLESVSVCKYEVVAVFRWLKTGRSVYFTDLLSMVGDKCKSVIAPIYVKLFYTQAEAEAHKTELRLRAEEVQEIKYDGLNYNQGEI
jgi:hypothetical protein